MKSCRSNVLKLILEMSYLSASCKAIMVNVYGDSRKRNGTAVVVPLYKLTMLIIKWFGNKAPMSHQITLRMERSIGRNYGSLPTLGV